MAFALFLILVGHTFFWVSAVNCLHSTALPYRTGKRITKVFFLIMALAPAATALGFWRSGLNLLDVRAWLDLPWPLKLAAAFFATLGAVAGIDLLIRRIIRRSPTALLSTRRSVIEVLPRDGVPGVRHHFLTRLPLNETLQLEIAERELQLPRLAASLDGLSVLHLSDLHFSGRIAKRYFEEVTRLANGMKPDLVAVTGDLIDHDDCIDWIPDTLGKLRAPLGVYFILGNHDARHDWARLRRVLVECALVDLGARWLRIEARGQEIVLAGNELPWFPRAADFTVAPRPSIDGGSLRLLLAHSPDQLPWARANAFDLMLAGHNHGGHIQLPLIGPVFAPSRYGVFYACGTFHCEPTLLHVSRGVSGHLPFRWNCRPEMVKLTLRAMERKPESRGSKAETGRKSRIRTREADRV